MLVKHGRRIVFGLFLVLLAGLLVFSSCDTADMTVLEQGQEESKTLILTTPLESDQLVDLVQGFNLKTREIQFKAGEITAGYSLHSDNLNQEIQNALKIHAENMSKILQFTESDQGGADITLRQEMQNSIVAASQGQVLFSGITALASPEVFNKIREQGIAEELILNDQRSTLAAPSPQSLSHESWAPYKGGATVTSGYIYNSLAFDPGAASSFATNHSYEHETHLWTGTGFVFYTGYWSSNLPNAYRDTQVCDSPPPVNLAIGTTNPRAITARRLYFTYMSISLFKNNIEIDIKGQLGKKWASWCHNSTWCTLESIDTTEQMTSFFAPSNRLFLWTY